MRHTECTSAQIFDSGKRSGSAQLAEAARRHAGRAMAIRCI